MSKMSYFFDILLFCVLIAKNVVFIRHFIPNFQHQNVENVELIRHFHLSEMVEVSNLENFRKNFEIFFTNFVYLLLLQGHSRTTLGSKCSKNSLRGHMNLAFFALRAKKSPKCRKCRICTTFPAFWIGTSKYQKSHRFPPPYRRKIS